MYHLAVPWVRRLVAGLSPRRPGLDPGSVHVGFVVDKVTLGQVFPTTFIFLCQFYSTGAPLHGKIKKKLIVLTIIITGLHKKPQGCGASVASAAGPVPSKNCRA
jgi:hypothetical protein